MSDLLNHPKVAEALDAFTVEAGVQRLNPAILRPLLTALLGALAEQGEGLDFDIPEKRLGIEVMDIQDYDPEKKTPPGMQPAWFAAYDEALDRRHRALVGALQQRIAELEGVARAYSRLHDALSGFEWSSRSVMQEVEHAMHSASEAP